ncbi:MAG: G8 domain-containing protein, partial [Bacteroidota bacterium]
MKKTFFLFLCLALSLSAFGQLPLPNPADYPHFQAVANGNWENPNVWGGSLPTDNAVVIIPAGRVVTITTQLNPSFKFVQVNGSLFMAIAQNTRLKTETIRISDTGYFRIGLPTNRVFDNRTAEVIFTNDGQAIDRSWDVNQSSRGLLSLGKIDIFGKIKTHMIPVNNDVLAGGNVIQVNGPVPADWEAGDHIVLPGTIFERYADFQDEKLTIQSIQGQTITVQETLQYDHIRTRTDMPLHLANLTRNVIFKSASTAIPLRGHIMIMNNDQLTVNKARIEHTAFLDLGRTDKSIPLDEITVNILNGELGTGLKNNVRGRYAVHFHKNGYGPDVNTPPSKVVGCVVEGTPGWGFVNHSSHVDIRENVCYDFTGSGFVTESGNELGNFTNNIAIKGTGNGEYRTVRLVFSNPERPQPLSDFGFSGDGFWFQGPAIRAKDNVAANCNGAGMIWFTLGSVEIEDNEMIGMDWDTVQLAYANYPGVASLNTRRWQHEPNEVFTADLPVLECDGFQAYACLAGFRFRFNNSSTVAFFNSDFAGGDVFGYAGTIAPAAGYGNNISLADRLTQTIKNLKLWNNEIGLRARYSSKTVFENVIISNRLRYENPIAYYPGMSCFHNINNYTFHQPIIEQYALGAKIIDDLSEPPSATLINPTFTHVATDIHDVNGQTCAPLSNIFTQSVDPNTTEIHFTAAA